MDSHYLYVFTWNPVLNRVSASSLAVNSREALELIPCNAVDRYGSGDAGGEAFGERRLRSYRVRSRFLGIDI